MQSNIFPALTRCFRSVAGRDRDECSSLGGCIPPVSQGKAGYGDLVLQFLLHRYGLGIGHSVVGQGDWYYFSVSALSASSALKDSFVCAGLQKIKGSATAHRSSGGVRD